MSWTIDIPYRTLDDELIDVVVAGRALPDPESHAVLRELVLEAAIAGDRTAGDLFDRLAKVRPAERRRLLDTMRERAGLESTSDVEGHERFLAANRALLGKRVSLDEPPPDEQPRFSPGGGIMIPNKAAIERERREDKLGRRRSSSASRSVRPKPTPFAGLMRDTSSRTSTTDRLPADRRLPAVADQVGVSVATHEAAHVAAAIFHRRRVEHVQLTVGSPRSVRSSDTRGSRSTSRSSRPRS